MLGLILYCRPDPPYVTHCRRSHLYQFCHVDDIIAAARGRVRLIALLLQELDQTKKLRLREVNEERLRSHLETNRQSAKCKHFCSSVVQLRVPTLQSTPNGSMALRICMRCPTVNVGAYALHTRHFGHTYVFTSLYRTIFVFLLQYQVMVQCMVDANMRDETLQVPVQKPTSAMENVHTFSCLVAITSLALLKFYVVPSRATKHTCHLGF